MLNTPPAPPQRPLPRAPPQRPRPRAGLSHTQASPTRPAPEAPPTHPGLVSGPGQGPRLLGLLPDTLTEGAGRGGGAGAHCGPDPKRPVFSDGPHAHPAIQARDSRQRGPSVPDDARVASAWRRPPGAWKGRSAELGLSWSGYGLPLPSLRLWALGVPACSLCGSKGREPPPGACGGLPRLGECRGPYPLLGQLHPHRAVDQWRRGSGNWAQIPPYSELGLGVGDSGGDVWVKSSQHAAGSGGRGLGGSLPGRWARTAEQEELTDDTGPGGWALPAAPGGQAPSGIAAPACDAPVLTGEQSQPGGPGWE